MHKQHNHTAGERKSLPGADRPLEFPLQWPTRQLCCWDSQGPRGARTFGERRRSCLGTRLPPAQVTLRAAVSVSPQHLGWTGTKEPQFRATIGANLAPCCLLSARLQRGWGVSAPGGHAVLQTVLKQQEKSLS